MPPAGCDAHRAIAETPTIDAYVQALIALLAIANPVGAAPAFLGIVQGFSREQKHAAALRLARRDPEDPQAGLTAYASSSGRKR